MEFFFRDWGMEFFLELEGWNIFFQQRGGFFFFENFRFFEIINFVTSFLKIYTFHYLKILCTDSIKKI